MSYGNSSRVTVTMVGYRDSGEVAGRVVELQGQ